MPFYDTAGSVKMIMEEGLTGCRRASLRRWRRKTTAPRILRRSIEDDRQNFTRFFLLRTAGDSRGQPVQAAEGHAMEDLAWCLRRATFPARCSASLSAFALRDLNLTKIESRPLRGKPWEYLFYLDFLGRVDSTGLPQRLGPSCAKSPIFCACWVVIRGVGSGQDGNSVSRRT